MSRQPEGVIVDRGIKALRAMGATAIKIHGSRFSRVGEPDVVGCYRGRSFAIEAKQPGEKPRPIQLIRLEEWAASGAITGVACSPEEFVQIVKEGFKQCPK